MEPPMQDVIVRLIYPDRTNQMIRRLPIAELETIASEWVSEKKCTVRILDSDLNLIVEKEYVNEL